MRGKFFAVLILSALSSWADIRLTEPGQPVVIGGKGIVFSEKLFSPADLPGLAAWYSADFGVLTSVGPDVPATDGQTVRRWLDRSGNGRHLDQATLLNQPTLTGGRVLGDGVSSYIANIGGFPSLIGSTIYLVLNQVSWENARRIYDTAIGGARVICYQRSITPRLAINSDNQIFNDGAVIGTEVVFMARQPTGTIGELNYTRVNSSAETSAALPGTLSASPSFALFGHLTGGGPVNVSIAEVVIFTQNHDEATQAKVRQYLARKWGISL